MGTTSEEDKTENYKCDQCPYETTLKSNIQKHESIFHDKKVEKHRKSLSVKEKRAIIEKYDMLPSSMNKVKKAESLGLPTSTLRSLLPQRDKIFSMKNTAIKRMGRHGKEKEVGFATLKWLRSARLRNENVTLAMIRKKASEIASRMDKDFLPSESWVSRLCRRGGISLKKDASPKSNIDVEKIVTTYEAMESLDVVYNFLIQNRGSQSALTALEEIMSFVDEKHKRKANSAEGDDKRLKQSPRAEEHGGDHDVIVKEEVLDDVEVGIEEGNFDIEVDDAEYDKGVMVEDANAKKGPDPDGEDVDVEGHEEDVYSHETPEDKSFNSYENEAQIYTKIKVEKPTNEDLSEMACTTPRVDLAQHTSCDECGLIFESMSELENHVGYAHAITLNDTSFEGNEITLNEGQISKEKRRISLTIQDKQAILKQYDLLPKMPNRMKAKMLGVKTTTLMSIISRREKIFSTQNTAMRRARFGKEKEVGDAVLQWLQSARERNEELSQAIIQAKTSEIAGKMGRDFSPSLGWVSRLCKRGNIRLAKGEPVIANEYLDVSMKMEDETVNTTSDKKARKPLNAKSSLMKSVTNPVEGWIACQECELVFGRESELKDHVQNYHTDNVQDESSESHEITATEDQAPEEKSDEQEAVPALTQRQAKTRRALSIRDKQALIKGYDDLPNYMSNVLKCQMLGVKEPTLRSLLSRREKIFSIQDPALKRARYGKDKEVEMATVMWLRSAIESSTLEPPFYRNIAKKASEMAKTLGKDYHPSTTWASRLCKRHNIKIATTGGSGENVWEEDTDRTA